MNLLSPIHKKKSGNLLHSKNKEKMKEFKRMIEWVEETEVKLQLNILTKKRLENMNDIQYGNKWNRYTLIKTWVDSILEDLLDIEDENIGILDKIAEFKKLIDFC